MIVSNTSVNESELSSALLGQKLALKNTFCAEVNCTNKYTRQVLVKSKTLDNTENGNEEIFQVPLCKHHYENFHSQIELENNIQVIPTGFDQN